VTEVVYRLYDVVDELSQVIEHARSVPMSGSCMVPRDHLLDLLDELRENLPEEVQQAGRIVEQRTEILEQAQAEAERLTGRTRGESEQLVTSARRQREEILGVARRQRDELLAQAQVEAEDVLAEAEVTSCSLSPRVRPVSRSASACACWRISVRCSTIRPACCTSSGRFSRSSSSRSSRWSRGTMQDPDIGTLRAFSMTWPSSSTTS
jgi:cell division septum initiation protein DivIVA